MTIVEQLTQVYLTKEKWHKRYLSEEEANKYHERLIMQGNIITYVDNGELIGYLEFWRINYTQLGRILCDNPIITDVEDIISGDIAYINNMWIREDARGTEAFNILGNMFLVKNQDAQIFCCVRRMKHHHPIQIYKRDELIKLYKGV